MEMKKELDDILLKVNLMTNLDILILDQEKVIYYLGNTNEFNEYIYAGITEEAKSYFEQNETKILHYPDTINIIKNSPYRYLSEAIYKMTDNNQNEVLIVFGKSTDEFDDTDTFIVESTVHLIEKYLRNKISLCEKI